MGERQCDRPFFARVESLRGIGALAVAAYHVSSWPVHGVPLISPLVGADTAKSILGRLPLLLAPGHAALMMFFVISGCVLRISLDYGPRDFRRGTVRFQLARVFRIYPIVIFGTLVSLMVNGWMAPSECGGALDVTLIIRNMLLIDACINATLWAIQLEALMAPLILLLYFLERSYGPRVLLIIAVTTTLLAFSKQWALWPPLSRNLFAFVLGMIIPTLGREVVVRLSRRAANRATVAAIIALVLPGPLFGLYSVWSAVVEAYAALALIALIAYRTDIAARILDHAALRALGRSSGSYYVLHVSLLAVVVWVANLLLPPDWNTPAPTWISAILTFTLLIAVVPFTVASYYLIEANGIALGRQIIRRRRLQPA